MSGSDQIQQLATMLDSSDDQKLKEIVTLFDRMNNRATIDHVLDRHRWRLALLRPPRPATASRLIVLPFEDLLASPDSWYEGSPRIPRRHLQGIMDAVMNGGDSEFLSLVEQVPSCCMMDDSVQVLKTGLELWPVAAERLFDRASGDGSRADKDERTFRISCRLAAQVLAIGETVVRTLWQLPSKPMIELSADARSAITAMLAKAAENGRESFTLAIEILSCRSDSPALIVPCIANGSFGLSERERTSCLSLIGETCTAAVRQDLRLLSGDDDQSIEVRVATFQKMATNLQALADVAADVRVQPFDIRQLRTEAAQRLIHHLTHAVEQVVPAMLDSLETDDDHAFEQVEKTARLVASLGHIGDYFGVGKTLQALLKGSSTGFVERANLLPCDSDRYLAHIRVVEILFGSGTATQLMSRRASEFLGPTSATLPRADRPEWRHARP